MHRYTDSTDDLADAVIDYARWRTRLDPIPLDGWKTAEDLAAECGPTVTPEGIGGMAALELFKETLGPACLSVDYPRYLSFVPAAPTEAAVLFDLVVGASSIYGGSWIEGSGAAYAENEALRWLSDLAGLPAEAGGTFVPGGTLGNLSALVAAREAAKAKGQVADRWAFVASDTAHSSVASAALVMAGSTNIGVIDDLTSVGELCRDRDVWMHVDAAYGGAALAAPSVRPQFNGIEHADSLIIDPHKWLFAPFDCCGLIYRNPDHGRAAHAQHAGYLEFLDAYGDWNPSDFAIQLTRRTRGLPFWFSLATYGTDAYAEAIQVALDLATAAADLITDADHLQLAVDPSLSIVVFERIGWTADDYQRWSQKTMQDGHAFVVPSRHLGRPVFRFCFVNPLTTVEDIGSIIALLA